MRNLALLTFCLSLVFPAAAEEWHFEGGATPIAWFDTTEAQFQFACRGGGLAMGFWVREPEAAVSALSAISVAITPDPAPGSTVTGGVETSFAQDMPLVHLEGASVIVRGPVARQWAQIAQGAREDMRVAFVQQGSGLEVFSSAVFGARGSNAAIAQVLGKCG